ncbi:hypothetical protein [Serratia marcescens]|uniref:hypothetical protein n=1 Tax=Serratia marcescens TaxID=615 RepID=UPI002FD8E6FC
MTHTLTTERLRAIASGDAFICTQDDESVAMARELLANREAQPVAGECDREVYENGKSACLVVIPKEAAEVICRGISEVTGCKVDWHYFGGRVHIKALTPPAPAVPTFEEWLSTLESKPLGWVRDSMKESYDACRAAMLAQPVSSGYKLPAHVYRELVNSLRDTAVKYQGTQQLREQLSRTLTDKGLSAAAPEGGNEN